VERRIILVSLEKGYGLSTDRYSPYVKVLREIPRLAELKGRADQGADELNLQAIAWPVGNGPDKSVVGLLGQPPESLL
jgi:hypothetical protein